MAKITINIEHSIIDNIFPIITILNKDTNEILFNEEYLGDSISFELPVGSTYNISTSSIYGYITPDSIEDICLSDKEINLNYIKGTRYGFCRSIWETDPDKRITYLYDAENAIPAKMDYNTNNFNYGTWEAFINEVATPVMLTFDGIEAYKLDKNNQYYKANSQEPSDITNVDFPGNAMVRFEKWKWVKRYSDAEYQYVIFSDCQYDEDYFAYAFQKEDGSIADKMYYGMFNGSLDNNNKLRSLADKELLTFSARSEEIKFAQNNGQGWNLIYNSAWQYIADLLTLISKNDNSQYSFGMGICDNSEDYSNTGILINKEGFVGTSDLVSGVKTFWIEHPWGKTWESMLGCVLERGKIKTKMYPPYNLTGENYIETNVSPIGLPTNFINFGSLNNESGFIPSSVTGSPNTYFCDGMPINNSQNCFALVGGGKENVNLCGSRALFLSSTIEDSSLVFGTRISYLANK